MSTNRAPSSYTLKGSLAYLYNGIHNYSVAYSNSHGNGNRRSRPSRRRGKSSFTDVYCLSSYNESGSDLGFRLHSYSLLSYDPLLRVG